MAASDPKLATLFALVLPTGPEQNDLLQPLFKALARQGPSPAAEWVLTLSEATMQQIAAEQLVAAFSCRSPRETADFLCALPHVSWRDCALVAELELWMTRDRIAALAWTRSLPDPDQRNALILQTSLSLARRDPRAAVTLTKECSDDAEFRNAAWTSIARVWSLSDPVSAIRQVSRTDDGPERTALLTGIVAGLSETWPTDAIVVLDGLPTEALRDSARLEVAANWASTDPASAAQWATTLTAGESRASAITTIAAQWVLLDASNAGQWLLNLPPGAERDRALYTALQQLSRKSPALASEWVASLDNLSLRVAAAQRVASNWLQSGDRTAALQWMHRIGISETSDL